VTLILELPDNKGAALKARAQEQGLSAEQYVQQILDRELVQPASPSAAPRRHISEVIREQMRDIPPDLIATLPTDGASEHDHYIYGWPKRNP
jgi:hypothetical protein